MPENYVDLIVTSPPYNVGIKYRSYCDTQAQDEYWKFAEEWMHACKRVLRVGGRICINIPCMGTNDKIKKSDGYIAYLPKYSVVLSKYFELREYVTWVKKTGDLDVSSSFCGNNTAWGSWLSPSCPYMRSTTEFIVVGHKELPKLLHSGVSDLTKEEFLLWTRDIWCFPTESDRSHPAPFPEDLPKRLIKLYTYIGDTVLDPFSGSGTTCVSAMKLKRKYIGIELDDLYVKDSINRVERERPTDTMGIW